MAVHLPDCVKDVIKQNMADDPAHLALVRCREFTKWTVRAEQLKERELDYKNGLPKHMQLLLKNKRLLLFKEMLDAVDFPDKQLVSDLSHGFGISGWQRKTGVFPPRVKRPQFSLGTLESLAKGLNRALLQQLDDDKDDEDLIQRTWDKTLEEVELGYIWQDDGADPMNFRFGLVQRAGKLRVIDDCSIGGFKSTVGAVEKYRVHAMDESAAFLAYLVDLEDGGLTVDGLSGRTYDLKHA